MLWLGSLISPFPSLCSSFQSKIKKIQWIISEIIILPDGHLIICILKVPLQKYTVFNECSRIKCCMTIQTCTDYSLKYYQVILRTRWTTCFKNVCWLDPDWTLGAHWICSITALLNWTGWKKYKKRFTHWDKAGENTHQLPLQAKQT